MDQRCFFNACMSLMNIDRTSIVDAGIISPVNTVKGLHAWNRFNDEPLVFLAKIDGANVTRSRSCLRRVNGSMIRRASH